MSTRRTNPKTGVVEEERWLGWVPTQDEGGHNRRINPETGVVEEERWLGWQPDYNKDGHRWRINPETGVEEEERWHGWVPTDEEHGPPLGSPGRRNKPSPDSPNHGEAAASSSDSSDFLGKMIGFFVAAGIVLWLIIMAVTITVMLAPIWLGAVAVGVVTGFLIGNNEARRLPTETLARVPVVEEPKRKKSRLRVSEEFLKAGIKLNPDLLLLIGATALYCIALAAWPFYTTLSTFTRVLLGVGSVAGIILGTMAGRRVLLWQYENCIFERTAAARQTRLLAPKVALGFSIPGFVALAGIWVAAIAVESGPWDFAKALGFGRQPSAGSHATAPSPPAPGGSGSEDLPSNHASSDHQSTFVGSQKSEDEVAQVPSGPARATGESDNPGASVTPGEASVIPPKTDVLPPESGGQSSSEKQPVSNTGESGRTLAGQFRPDPGIGPSSSTGRDSSTSGKRRTPPPKASPPPDPRKRVIDQGLQHTTRYDDL